MNVVMALTLNRTPAFASPHFLFLALFFAVFACAAVELPVLGPFQTFGGFHFGTISQSIWVVSRSKTDSVGEFSPDCHRYQEDSATPAADSHPARLS